MSYWGPKDRGYQESLPVHQHTKNLAATAAKTWASNPVNKLQLPSQLEKADVDGDGTINRQEFMQMLQNAGAKRAHAEQLFTKFDKVCAYVFSTLTRMGTSSNMVSYVFNH